MKIDIGEEPSFLHPAQITSFVVNREWLEWRATELNGGARADVHSEVFQQAISEAIERVVNDNPETFSGRDVECTPLSSSITSPYIVKVKRESEDGK